MIQDKVLSISCVLAVTAVLVQSFVTVLIALGLFVFDAIFLERWT